MKVLLTNNGTAAAKELEDGLRRKEDITITGVARNGWECLDYMQETMPEVVVMDLMMPRLDGLGVLQRMKDIAVQPKVIVVASILNEKQLIRCLEKGAEDVMVRPLEPEVVYERIQEICRYSPKVNEPPRELYQASCTIHNEKVYLEQVADVLYHMGMPVHLRGYLYIRDAIIEAMHEFDKVGNATKTLYPEIARRHHTTPMRVERAIRHAIDLTWERGNHEYIGEYFDISRKNRSGRITNSEFIAVIADRLSMRFC